MGEQAVEVGLADAVDSYHRAYGNLNIASDVRILQKSPFQKIYDKVHRMHLNDW